ncbi:Detected protein of unknown function [Hibiscus syriacus]|uniref:Pentatricopeptide repeat-containing protein n=1 Tax=Hibiscus syriacus TaxID=106335 RepID=A0A6A3B2B0_HIBSY|nr:Detected protein of unknown function [Hibiscus syriacus]
MIKLLGSIKHVSKSTLLKNRNVNSYSYSSLFVSSSSSHSSSVHRLNLSAKDVVASLRDWFKPPTPNTALLDRIFSILSSQEQAARDDASSRHSADLALSHLNIHLSEAFVLQVLSYGRRSSKGVLSCLKFFDWAGRQPGFQHTRTTYHAIFKILSKAKLMPLMLEFLQDFMKHGCIHRIRFYETLVMGYALAGKPGMALQLFGRMRFQGIDLDTFAYHVLLNALVDESCFDAADMVAKQISMRGFENDITYSILVKGLCKQNKLDEAEAYLRSLAEREKSVSGHAVSIIVNALCKGNRFKHASTLLEEFTELNVSLEHAYGIWLHNVVQRGRLNWSLDFVNIYDLLIEMEKDGISPDRVTMNAVLCFFCKAGMVDVAIELYNSSGVIDEAYRVLRNSIREGYLPSKKILTILVDALCKEGKLNKIKELVVLFLERKFRPSYASNRGDIAATLLLEMQEKAHKPNRKLFKSVICCLCGMQSPENQFFKLLEMQLSQFEPSSQIFNYFIVGAGHAKKPELAREVFEMMQRSGIMPSLKSDILMLLSYLKNDRISDGLNFFNDVHQRRRAGRKLYSSVVVGLCKADRIDYALNFMREMGNNNVLPSMECYELLIQSCVRRKVMVWPELQDSSDISFLGQLIGIFSGCVKANQDIENLEEIIAKCFPVDVYTYNTLLRKLSVSKVDQAFELYDWICEKGYEPNRWTYDIIIHGLLKKGRRTEAQRWLEEMFEKGFDLTESTKLLI